MLENAAPPLWKSSSPMTNSSQCHQIRSGFKIRAFRHDILLTIRFIEIRLTVRRLKIPHFSNFSELPPPPPNYPKESRSVPVMSIMYLGLVLIFPTEFHPDPSTLSVFQDFRFPPPKSSPQCHQILSGLK